MIENAKILVIGAGWRVRQFILPALRILKVGNENITILRKSREDFSQIHSIRTVYDINELSHEYDIVINCAHASVMLDIQLNILCKFPCARHFVDTPIVSSLKDLLKVLPLIQHKNISTLEDWPYLPNIKIIHAKLDKFSRIYIHHFGIHNHFLSLSKFINGYVLAILFYNKKEKRLNVNGRIFHCGPKDYSKSYIHVQTCDNQIVDYFELSPQSPSVNTIYRHYSNGKLSYCLNEENLYSLGITEDFMRPFLTDTSRQNVHELDKIIALTKILKGTENHTYSVMQALIDVVASRVIERLGFGIHF